MVKASVRVRSLRRSVIVWPAWMILLIACSALIGEARAQESTVLYSVSQVDDTVTRISAYEVDPVTALSAYLADPSSQTGTQPLFVDLDGDGIEVEQGFYDNLNTFLAAHYAPAAPPPCPDCDVGAKVTAAGFTCGGGCNPPSNCTPRFTPVITCANDPPCPPDKTCLPDTTTVKGATYAPPQPCECVDMPATCQKKDGAKMKNIITKGAVCKCQMVVATPALRESAVVVLTILLIVAMGFIVYRRRFQMSEAR